MKKIDEREERKSKIFTYIKKNPLCAAHEISYEVDSKQIRYSFVKDSLDELIEQAKVGFFMPKSTGKKKRAPRSYFVIPRQEEEDKILWKIMSSNKILTLGFRNFKFRNIRGEWSFQLLIINFIAWFHLQLKIYSIGKVRSEKMEQRFQKNFVRGWKKYVNSSIQDKNNAIHDIGFIDFLGTIIAEDFPNLKEYFKELSIHKFPLKWRMELMNKFFEEGDFKGVAMKYKPKQYEFAEPKKSKTTPKYIKNRLKSIMTNDNKFSWEKALSIQQVERGMYGRIFDPEFVKLLRKSKVDKNEILNYAYMTTGWFDQTKKEMKSFIRDETGISLS